MTASHIHRLGFLPAYAAHDPTGWSRRHRAAIACPTPGHEAALVGLLKGWLAYADAHERQYESALGADGVLGPCWAQVGVGLRGLLNGPLGRLDGGTLDSLVGDLLTEEGLNPD